MSDAKIQSRKFQLTINNPQDCGMTHDVILDRAALFHPAYFCMADEIGEQGTYHTHAFLFSHSPHALYNCQKQISYRPYRTGSGLLS